MTKDMRVRKHLLAGEVEASYRSLSPEQTLWWNVLTMAIREAIRDKLGKPNIAGKRNDAMHWLTNRKNKGVGSVIWVLRALDIHYIDEVIQFLKKATEEELEATLKSLQ
jgi:hypothetical protein